MQSSEPIIQLVGLGKEFRTAGGRSKALDDINLTICQGEIFGIIGLSGAGKSTLVRCINYLEVPTSGEVLFENTVSYTHLAAYKTAGLASMLVKKGCHVQVLMTENATNFINPITFETLTGNKCLVDTFDRNFEFSVEHVALAKQADVVMIAQMCIRDSILPWRTF